VGLYLLLVDAFMSSGRMGIVGYLLLEPADSQQSVWRRVGLLKRRIFRLESEASTIPRDVQGEWNDLILNWTDGFDSPISEIKPWERRDLTII